MQAYGCVCAGFPRQATLELIEVVGMPSSRNPADPREPKPPSFGTREFLVVVFLAVIFFLLGHSMVRHRFFEGGRIHRNGSIGQ